MDSFQILKKTEAYVFLYVYKELSNCPTQFGDVAIYFLAY